MSLFTKNVPVKTVADAIAPFREVQENLGTVLGETAKTKATAAKRIADAKAYADNVEKTETAASESASAEEALATKILQALSAILGDESE